MRTESVPAVKKLSEYTPPDFLVDSVDLHFSLNPKRTRVVSKLRLRRNGAGSAPLILDGEDIELISASIDGHTLARREYSLTKSGLTIPGMPDICELEIVSECAPEKNTKLMGLYVSGGRFCTQCEAEGFRRITFFPDRPDILSKYMVRIEASKSDYPQLLSNGNCTARGELDDGRHFAVWEDPHPKPCYLFALVAGEFDQIDDQFTTKSGRDVALTIFVDPGDAPRAHYAMDALKRSMDWDERVYGREYDLDLFMIVAVRDFNFGAMENKGLNIFNSALLLADEASATDMNFEFIESVVAHEYFHNWTGNRITCRDWFQLCLKEGFTVFRDQCFSADMRGADLQRIKDVRALRARQFPEDAGPLAHPVRPSSYEKIDNFYTATVYEKGAELIRMLRLLMGADKFRKGCDRYFETLDGQAATVEQFYECFQPYTDLDLQHFQRWYSQAGTPRIAVKAQYSSAGLAIELVQQTRGAALIIPLDIALVSPDGKVSELPLHILDKERAEIIVGDADPDSALSIGRGFSAPVIIDYQQSAEHAARIMALETDSFSRFEAGQALAQRLLVETARALETGRPVPSTDLQAFSQSWSTLLCGKTSNGFKALALTLPPDSAVILAATADGGSVDPLAVYEAGKMLRRALAERNQSELLRVYEELSVSTKFVPDAQGAGQRALKNMCLGLLSLIGGPHISALAYAQFSNASNMTDELAALMVLIRMDRSVDEALAAFYQKWSHNPLVIDKWFAAQSGRGGPDVIAKMSALIAHPEYKSGTPNRIRSLIGGFAMGNPKSFHVMSGSGYQFFAEQILEIDGKNPQVAARLSGAFENWRRYDPQRQSLIAAQLRRILRSSPSENLREIISKSLR